VTASTHTRRVGAGILTRRPRHRWRVPATLIVAAAAIGVPSTDVAAADAAASSPFAGDALYLDVVRYSDLGEHRAGTEVDLRTSEWLFEEIGKAGLDARKVPVSFRQFFPRQHSLTVGERQLECFPLWWPTVTGPTPLRATLAQYREDGPPGHLRDKIAVITFPRPRGSSTITADSYHNALIAAVAEAGAVAIAAITPERSGDFIGQNAGYGTTPWPVPILLVAGREGAFLNEAAAEGREATFLLDGEYRETTLNNVIGTTGEADDLVVVTTPASGWFRCAGERGPGIAMWLAMARWVGRRSGGQLRFVFAATPGHELHGVGMRQFLDEEAPPPEEVRCWIHFGAGAANYAWQETEQGLLRLARPEARYVMYSEGLRPLLEDAFEGVPAVNLVQSDTLPSAMSFVLRRGYRGFGVVSGHAFVHAPGDLARRVTGPELLKPMGEAFRRALIAIEAEARGDGEEGGGRR
jgi:hypothetical protein